MVVSMPEEQVDALKRLDFKPAFGLGRAGCAILHKEKKTLPEENGGDSTLTSDETTIVEMDTTDTIGGNPGNGEVTPGTNKGGGEAVNNGVSESQS